jgi:hypothetical protein
MAFHADLAHFARFGFVVLRRAFDPSPLSDELDRAIREGSRAPFGTSVGGADLGGRYLPMMCERTPVSLSLLDQFAGVAAQLLGVSVRERAEMFAGLPGLPIDTEPGDAIFFDEHLYHASSGGMNRRQWRVDYIVDPVGDEQETAVRHYFASIFVPGWDGGYDVDLYPTDRSHWRASGRTWLRRLDELGAHAAAAAEESAAPKA